MPVWLAMVQTFAQTQERPQGLELARERVLVLEPELLQAVEED